MKDGALKRFAEAVKKKALEDLSNRALRELQAHKDIKQIIDAFDGDCSPSVTLEVKEIQYFWWVIPYYVTYALQISGTKSDSLGYSVKFYVDGIQKGHTYFYYGRTSLDKMYNDQMDVLFKICELIDNKIIDDPV